MDKDSVVALSMLNGESGKYGKLFNFFVCSFPSSSAQDQLTVPTPFVIISFPPILDTLLKIMGYILSVNMSYSENI